MLTSFRIEAIGDGGAMPRHIARERVDAALAELVPKITKALLA